MSNNTIITIIGILDDLKLPYRFFEFTKCRKIRQVGYLWFTLVSYLMNILVKKIKVEHLYLNREYRTERIIASLTTYPARINTVAYSIYTIFMQSYKPDRIILWLAEDQFPEKKLPDNLTGLVDRGLEIRYIKNYRSHKKYFHALQEQQPNELVVTFDDDIIYSMKTIENCLLKHNSNPKAIVVNMARRVQIASDNSLLPYSYWPNNHKDCIQESFKNMPLTGSGCMYPYNVLNKNTFDFGLIQKCALYTDDLWIYVQSILNGTKIVSVDKPASMFTMVTESQTLKLTDINCDQGGNDKSIKLLLVEYPQILNIIKEDDECSI